MPAFLHMARPGPTVSQLVPRYGDVVERFDVLPSRNRRGGVVGGGVGHDEAGLVLNDGGVRRPSEGLVCWAARIPKRCWVVAVRQ